MKRKDETNEKKDTDDLGSTGDESEDGQSSNTHNDQDRHLFRKRYRRRKIDTTVIEEEDWIDYIKEAQTKPWKRWKMRRFDVGTRLMKE